MDLDENEGSIVMPATPDDLTVQVLYLCLLEASRVGARHAVDSSLVMERTQDLGLTEDQVYTSLNRLERLDCIRVYTLQHGKIKHFTIGVDAARQYTQGDHHCAEALNAFVDSSYSDNPRHASHLLQSLSRGPATIR